MSNERKYNVQLSIKAMEIIPVSIAYKLQSEIRTEAYKGTATTKL